MDGKQCFVVVVVAVVVFLFSCVLFLCFLSFFFSFLYYKNCVYVDGRERETVRVVFCFLFLCVCDCGSVADFIDFCFTTQKPLKRSTAAQAKMAGKEANNKKREIRKRNR